MRHIRTSGSMSGRRKRTKVCGAEPRRGTPETRPCRDLLHRATSRLYVRRVKASFFSGCDSHLATVAPASSNRSGGGGNETAEAFDGKYRKAVPRARQAITRVNAEQASKLLTREPTQLSVGEGRRGRCPGSNLIPATIPPG